VGRHSRVIFHFSSFLEQQLNIRGEGRLTRSPYKETSVWFNPKISMYSFGIIIFLLPKIKNDYFFLFQYSF